MENSHKYAQSLDKNDELKNYKTLFFNPKSKNSVEKQIYFLGNSLGLQPKSVDKELQSVLKDWKNLAGEGHFEGATPWVTYVDTLIPPMAKLVGAKPLEVSIMNSLTVNIHLLLATFYRPTKKRFKIICEENAFSSDRYALKSHLRWHGLDPNEALITVKRKNYTSIIHEEDILEKLEEHSSETALVFFGGVNYYSGQLFNMKKITKYAHEIGAYCGWDLAHAVGNVQLDLHKWGVDFAAWCTYKYLNAGPGSTAAIYINETHFQNKELNRLEGWWGNDSRTRFEMLDLYIPEKGANAWQQSNPSIFSLAPLKASLEIFNKVPLDKMFEKSKKLTAYLEYVLQPLKEKGKFKIITPNSRGAQLSISFDKKGNEVFNYLKNANVVVDWRAPNVIRIAPNSLYNSFEEVYQFGKILEKSINALFV